MRFFLRFFFFLIFLFSITFVSLYGEDKIYIFHIKVKGNDDRDLEKKIRGGLLLSILKQYPGKFKIMDDDSIQDLSKKLEKLQLAGCSEEICVQEISQSIDARDLISGSVIQTGSRLSFNLKKVRKDEYSFQQTTESTFNEEFDISQLDYFLDEAARKLIEKNYTVNKKNAPSTLVTLDDSGIESAKEKPINDIYLSTSNPRNRILWELLKEPLEDAFTLRKKGKEKESAEAFFTILTSIEASLPGEVIQLAPILEVLASKVNGGYSRYFSKRIRELDESFNQKKYSDEMALSGYESLLDESLRIPKNHIPEDKIVLLRLRISQVYETKGDNEFRSTRFTPAKALFQKALNTLQNKEFSKNPQIQSALSALQKKIKENESTAKSFIQNKIRTNCDTIKAQFIFSRMNGRSAPEESKKARELGATLLRETEEILNREKEFGNPELDNILESAKKENY